MKALAAILASTLFFPVSCTIGLVAGTQALAKRDVRVVAAGDKPHPCFGVAVEPGDAGKPFRVLSLEDVVKPRNVPGSLRLSRNSAAFEEGDSKYAYVVLEDYQGEQLVELKHDIKNGDRTCWSRWRASATSFTPVSSRMMQPSYMFVAFPFAFGISLLLYGLGRRMRRQYATPVAN